MPATSTTNFSCCRCGDEHPLTILKRVDGERYCPTCYRSIFTDCSGCGDIVVKSTTDRVGTRYYCEDCFAEQFADCHGCGTSVAIEEGRQHTHLIEDTGVEETHYYCSRCYDRDFRRCDNCGNRHPRDTMRDNPYGERMCRECWDTNCRLCDICGRTTFNREVRWFGDEARCHNCSQESEEWDQQEFKCDSPTFDRIPTARKFGVEIETARCDTHWELWGNTIWGCEYDCSVSGKEFISPPMFGDQGLDSILEFCREAQNRDWSIDDRCGLHLHFDMADMTDEQLFSIAYAYRQSWALWKRFVSSRRGGYDMCGSPRYTVEDLRREKCWEYFVGARDRFEYVNWRAYFKHGTFEIRIGEPTLDGSEIVNWVRTHALFIEHVKDMTFDELDAAFADGSSSTRCFSFCANFVWNEHADLIEYLRNLSRRYHDRSIQIRGPRHYPEHSTFAEA